MGPGSAFLPRFFPFSPTAEPGSRLKEVRSSYYSEKGLAYNSIIMLSLLLKLIFVIVFRLTDGVMHVLSSINFLLRDPRFGFPATSLGDPIVTQLSLKVRHFSSLT